MCAAMVGAAAVDMAVKELGAVYPVAEIAFFRTVIALPVILLFVIRQEGIRALIDTDLRWQLWRSCLAAAVIFGFYFALTYMPIVQAVMLAYVGPVLIVLLAKPLLGESLSLRKLAGIGIGFCGVFVVVDPLGATSAGEFTLSPAILAALGSAFCWALLSLSNRQLKERVSTPVLTFYAYPVTLLVSGYLVLDSWIAPQSPLHWLLFVTIAAGSLLTQLFVTLAYKSSEAGRVAPFEYTSLLWVALGGFVFWREVPTAAVWFGGLAIIAGGYMALRSKG